MSNRLTRDELDKAALRYLEYVCDKTGAVPSKTREIFRHDVRRDLGIDESAVVGYLASKGFVEYDTGQVHLTEKAVRHLRSLQRCTNPTGTPGRPNRDELDEAAGRFMELLLDQLDGIAEQERDADSHEIAREAKIEHDDDVFFVVYEYLYQMLGFVGLNGMSSVYLTDAGIAHVRRLRSARRS